MTTSLPDLPTSAGQLELNAPPPELEPDSFAARLYVALAPLARQDDLNEWSLLILCNAIGTMFQLLDDLVRDSPDGPGWSILMDADRCPDVALPWLAQFVGVRVLPDSTADEQRARLKATDGFHRGTPAAIRAAVAATLTGTQTVVLRERDGSAYRLSLSTLDTETPDKAKTQAAFYAQKPAGLVPTFSGGAASQTYAQLNAGKASYAAVKTSYPTYNGVLLNSNV